MDEKPTVEVPQQDAESFVRMLLWDTFPECCGCPEPASLSDAQIVASLRERFPEVATRLAGAPEAPMAVAALRELVAVLDDEPLPEARSRIEWVSRRSIAMVKAHAALVQAAVEPTAPASEVVQPVAFCNLEMWASGKFWPDDCFSREQTEGTLPLYTAPAISLAGLEEVKKALENSVCAKPVGLTEHYEAIATINNLIEVVKGNS
jgi:hypothetical protein